MVARLIRRTRRRYLNLGIFRRKSVRSAPELQEVQAAIDQSPSIDASLNEEPEPPSGSVNLEQLGNIARSSVQLAALGPKLAKLAADMEAQSQAQAKRAGAIAKTMEVLTLDLEKAVCELRASSVQVDDALATVSRIADHTRIISLNASIEAARAGIHGRAFGVVVEEVQRLADRTGSTTHLIEDRMDEMRSSIVRVARVTGDKSENQGAQAERSVEAVNSEVHGMAQSAEQQLGGSQSLHTLSDKVLDLAEALLLSVGAFRFDAHSHAEHEVEQIVPELLSTGQNRRACEDVLKNWLRRHPYFELAYLTDSNGRQFIDNIANKDGQITHDKSGYGRDWSERPWYQEALRSQGVHATDIYRSTATGDFCFTIAVALRDSEGQIQGVLGADVNFQKLVEK
jgi:methyl-accepting chemotaxis protein